ncbi:hypothetical protein EGW08_020648 [Elysia chlorotica]|uniref:Uncharacterized protein n=1 Tax=Elysia chlorotica TaxID=188477 RepID=A0A433SQP1_ELYCH|nr:hypothetical protein EGW08_020648 [Elysia chlorotica]
MSPPSQCASGLLWQRCLPFSRHAISRLLPLAVLIMVFIHFTFLSPRGGRYTDAQHAARHAVVTPGVSTLRLIPSAVLNRGHSARDRELTEARRTLEYWWSLKLNMSGGAAEPCPLSMSGPPKKNKNRRFDFYIEQTIEILEAMGFTNITTCYGRYPTFANVTPYVKPNSSTLTWVSSESSPLTHNVVFSSSKAFQGRPHDKMAELLVETQAVQTHNEDMITRTFCYTPTFRPQQKKRFQTRGVQDGSNWTQTPATEPPLANPDFCPRLLKLYRAIQAGREPPLLTLFTWFPDVLDDPVRDLRRLMLVNMDQFRPFVQPVLVSDRRMVMSLANGLSWPCLPISQLSPDGFPVFKAASADLTKIFNSTFYGYVQRKTLLDASLLETLMAVKEKYLVGARTSPESTSSRMTNGEKDRRNPELDSQGFANRGDPPILLHGSAMFTKSLSSVKTHHGLSVLAEARKDIDLNKVAPLSAYVIFTKNANFSDLPPVRIDDKFLIPLLSSRSRLLGDLVIDTSNTVISLYTFNNNTLSDWDRKFLVSTSRNETYNQVLSDKYFKKLRQTNIASPLKNLIVTKFDENGNILFKET